MKESRTRRRIGLLGGSFDPVHLGHLTLARTALERAGLDEVRFLPAALSPNKTRGPHAADEDRLEMLARALAGEPRFRIDPRELDRPGPSYTVDTLRSLADEAPDADLFFLIGGDNLATLPGWRDLEEVLALATFLVLIRPGDGHRPAALPPDLPEGLRLQVLEGPEHPASSTEVRRRIERGDRIADLVGPEVAALIEARGLYRA